jgi:hypothetical protein
MVTTDPARLAVAVMPPADTGLAPAAGGRTGNARFIAGARSDVPDLLGFAEQMVAFAVHCEESSEEARARGEKMRAMDWAFVAQTVREALVAALISKRAPCSRGSPAPGVSAKPPE